MLSEGTALAAFREYVYRCTGLTGRPCGGEVRLTMSVGKMLPKVVMCPNCTSMMAGPMEHIVFTCECGTTIHADVEAFKPDAGATPKGGTLFRSQQPRERKYNCPVCNVFVEDLNKHRDKPKVDRKVIDRIMMLWDLHDDQEGTPEGDSAKRSAERTMEKYGVTPEMVGRNG
jgi:hypothetical protein